MTDPASRDVGTIEIAVFGVELVLLAVPALAGARLGSGVLAIVLAVVLPLAAVVIWARALAPRAARRLRYPMRLGAKFVLALVASALLAVSGLAVWAAAFLVVSSTLFAAGEAREQEGHV